MQSITGLFLAIILFAGHLTHASLEDEFDSLSVRDSMEATINNTLNAIIQNLTDPISLGDFEIDLSDPNPIKGSLNLSNIELGGLKNILLTALKISLSKSIVDIEISNINLNLDYVADFLIASLLPFFGSGKVNVDIEEIGVDATFGVNIFGSPMSISNLNITIHLGAAIFDISGILNDDEMSEFISTFLTTYVAPLINDNAELISGIINPIIENAINDILKGNATAFFDEYIDRLYNDLSELEQKSVMLKE